MTRPEVWTLAILRKRAVHPVKAWTLRFLKSRVEDATDWPIVEYPKEPAPGVETVVAIGGGVLIDTAKVWRKEKSPRSRLIAVPSVWGSGAENSPIAVIRSEDGKKLFFKGDEYLPDARVVWPELASTLSPQMVRHACGDVWAHSLEGFFSPLASDALRDELACLISRLLQTPIDNRPEWFEFSAQACRAQARSSVGLVHGMAHVLEEKFAGHTPPQCVGHAELCSTFLWPVFKFNQELGDKNDVLCRRYDIDQRRISLQLKEFFDPDLYARAVPLLKESWRTILRDQCTRTNSVLVRPNHLAYFADGIFP